MERKKAASEQMAIQSGRMAALGKMGAGIAHEINNPLAVIAEKAGWIKDLLREEDLRRSPTFQEFADAVAKIEDHVLRAKKITHRLLSFGRRTEPVREQVDVNQVLDETLDFPESEARHRTIAIQTDLSPDLPRLTSDSAQLQQVFLNILNNALDAIGKNGLIRIKTRHMPEYGQIALRSATTVRRSPGNISTESLTPFSPPRKWARAPDWGSPSPATSWRTWGGA